MSVARRTQRAAAVLVLVTLGVSCTNILGLDADFADAASGICLCADVLVLFGGSTSKCRKFLNDGLQKATPDEQAAWLQVYQDNRCNLCTSNGTKRLQCIFASPVCVELGGGCTEPLECCGYLNFADTSGAKAACLPTGDGDKASCQKCIAVGQPCETSLECCGYPFITTNEYNPPYCDPTAHVCVTEADKCVKTGGECSFDIDCCGSEAGLGHCSTSGKCEEECNPDDPVNCPGCCGATSGIDIDYPYQCLDGKDIAKCPNLCRVEQDECAAPTVCDSVCNSLFRCISLCQ